MNIAPMSPAVRPRPYAMVTPGRHSLLVRTPDREYSVNGRIRCYAELERLRRHVIYVDGRLLNVRHATGAKVWQAQTWRGRATSLTLDGAGTRVLSLRGSIDSGRAGFEDLVAFLSWLNDQGVAPGSMSTMGWNLWRRSLDRPVSMAMTPQVGHAALYGGRQEATEPRTYRHMVQWDMRAAYVHAMASLGPFAATLRRVSSATRLDPERAGLVEARVTVPPDLAFPPLPVRVTDGVIQWQRGIVSGTWPWREVAKAKDLGCDVTVSRVWAPIAEVEPFGRWSEMIAEGRALPHGAAKLVKHLANTLWGTFGMTSTHRAVVRWRDDAGDHPMTVGLDRRRLPHAATSHIAAETASRVRTRLLGEGLNGSTGRVVHVDTDGIIVGRNRRHPDPSPLLGGWVQKRRMRMLEIRAPQVYRYKDQCSDCWEATYWHYVTAGTTPDHAAELFERTAPGTTVAVLGHDMVLPPGHATDQAKIRAWTSEGYATQHAMFGPRLTDV